MELFITWDLDPVFFRFFGLEVRYYGLTWAMAIMMGTYIFKIMQKREGGSVGLVDDAFLYIVLGTIIGARLGHCFFYEPLHYLTHPLQIFNFREGGLASHGALLGGAFGSWLFCYRRKLSFLWILDRIAFMATGGGAVVRLGNLMNSEIYGDATTRPWGFIFVRAGETIAKHPTQIYEALMYFLAYGLLIYLYLKVKNLQNGFLFGLFLIMVFTSRLIIESIKEEQIQAESTMFLNLGQLLSIPFILLGLYIVYKYRGIKHK